MTENLFSRFFDNFFVELSHRNCSTRVIRFQLILYLNDMESIKIFFGEKEYHDIRIQFTPVIRYYFDRKYFLSRDLSRTET